jgi:hypothetical protein
LPQLVNLRCGKGGFCYKVCINCIRQEFLWG